MSDVTLWFAILNGRSFRGLSFSADLIDLQTQDHLYPSWRKTDTFEDVLLVMALKGEKSMLPEIKAPSPLLSSVTTDLNHLTVSSLSILSEQELRMLPPTSACGGKTTQFYGTTRSSNLGSSSKSPHLRKEGRNPTFRPPPSFTVQSRGAPARPIYKFIRNIAGTVGTITDRSGVLLHITAEDHSVLGHARAMYLDAHGYGVVEISKIVSAFDAPTIDEFIARAEGCGMAIVELEWFWALE
ncbi:hypothetical protein BJ322DRAFT_1114295 [Thelephora terrestris]|uniref:Uncharacterized protein n=1 Tax=Thelephora terrestris TaxID=56493 RepID=A0A9P6H3M0_9AGAM|nr:hypothetical protein BJ322DRAFT_1114295 [Thelephora terrestris]